MLLSKCDSCRRFTFTSTSVLAFVALLASLSFAPVHAQQPDARTAATALQEVVAAAIKKNGASVVSIARVRKPASDQDQAPPLPFGLQGLRTAPTDPAFIPDAFGAGVVVDKSGLIVTTLHVLGNLETSDHYVWSQKRPFKAEIVATSPWYDLAVLRIEAEDLTAMPLGDATELEQGHFVIALGNPYAIARDGNVSAHWAIVSNTNRPAPAVPTRSKDPQGRETLHHFGTLIETDTHLAAGFSGGALLNLDGEMVGLMTTYTASPKYETAAGLAIPVDDAFKRVLGSLKRGEAPEFGFLGVGPSTLSAALRRTGHHGARIDSVVEGTPAAKTDLRPDDVITHVGDQTIFHDADLFREVGQAAPGTILSLRVVRGDRAINETVLVTEVTISKKYVSTSRRPVVTRVPPDWRGMRVEYATASPSFSQRSPRPPADSLLVMSVLEDSPTWNAGLRADDFITHVGELPVKTPREFAKAVADATDAVTIHVLTDDDSAERTVSP